MPLVFHRPAVCQVPQGVRSYASGSNFAGEIRGFSHVGIPVGIAADMVKPAAVAELLALPPTYPLFVDSGAFSEVTFDPAPRGARTTNVLRTNDNALGSSGAPGP